MKNIIALNFMEQLACPFRIPEGRVLDRLTSRLEVLLMVKNFTTEIPSQRQIV